MNRCTRIGEEGGSRPITEEDRAAIAAANDGMAQKMCIRDRAIIGRNWPKLSG